jgi:hypothetical protein
MPLKRSIFTEIKSEEGSVESALVLIPLLILFLLAVQMGIVVNYRNMDQMYAQSAASSRAISGQIYISDQVIDLNSPDSFQQLKLLLTEKKRRIPTVLPSALLPGLSAIFGGGKQTSARGLAVIELAP